MRVMVTGGAGYIGAHLVRLLVESGGYAVVVDDLSTGSAERLPTSVDLEVFDMASDDAEGQLAAVMAAAKVDVVVHLAAKKAAEESSRRPTWYYRQNVGSMIVLLDAIRAADVTSLVFSWLCQPELAPL